MGADSHALAEPAQVSAWRCLRRTACVQVLIDARGGYTPTPAVSRSILAHNSSGGSPLADGIVATPSHNPPSDGGFKYNSPTAPPLAPRSRGISKTGRTICSAKGWKGCAG
jgi:phosphoglucomutase